MDPVALIKIAILLLAACCFFAYWVFNFIILYHLLRFGIGVLPKKCALIFMIGAIALSFLSTLAFANLPFDSLLNSF